ncbi:MAG: hypothetical protein H7A23_12730 [Leptospiraceae bacterium]|nr:hypothetical protein [Leptospiraceae bacterium]MCP5495415.1 hypothetical protein [Leptospiraceae bacterium]
MENNDNYEFNEKENLIFSDLAHKMRYVGVFGIILGFYNIVLTISDVTNFFFGITYIFLGAWTIRAAKSFQLVVDTQGNDIQYLMDALKELKKLFTLQFYLYPIVLTIVCLSAITLYYMGTDVLDYIKILLKK